MNNETIPDIFKVTDITQIPLDSSVELLSAWNQNKSNTIKESNLRAYAIGKVLNHQRKNYKRGSVNDWEKNICEILHRSKETIRLYMRVAKFFDSNPTLSNSLLCLPLQKLNKQVGRKADFNLNKEPFVENTAHFVLGDLPVSVCLT